VDQRQFDAGCIGHARRTVRTTGVGNAALTASGTNRTTVKPGQVLDRLSALALDQQVAALRAQGTSEAQVQRLREQHLGIEGASSISAMEA
jgi:hypothetical protein